jgi:hypothetical protein
MHRLPRVLPWNGAFNRQIPLWAVRTVTSVEVVYNERLVLFYQIQYERLSGALYNIGHPILGP